MATIYGTLESLKALKSELKSNGISRFSSIKEIKAFLSSYNSEKLTILNAESVKQEMESRGSDIRDWFLTHMEAGTSAKAASLLNQENNQCVNIIFWLKDRL